MLCKRKLYWIILSALFLVVIAGCTAETTNEENAAAIKIAGNYICFDEHGDASMKKGIITIDGDRITAIDEYRDNEKNVIYLDDECVIFPGLIDLHSHVEFNFAQLWKSDETEAWDNRFEWRNSAQYTAELKSKQALLAERWSEPFNNSEITVGDIFEYFTELQAAAGGTTLIQGYNQTDTYDTADSHEKIDLIRDTCYANDLGREKGQEVRSVIQLFKPDHDFDKEVPETYLHPEDISKWGIVYQVDEENGKESLANMLDSIATKTSGGYLIHISEGRAGNLKDQTDSFCTLEYEQLKHALQSGVENGTFTVEDVRNAHINLIHACGTNLDNAEDRDFIKNYGIGLIWSPVSNLILYGDTPVFYKYLDDDNLILGIGSDWSPSGSKTVWDECKFANAFIRKNLPDKADCTKALLKACTYTAANMIGENSLGNIREGNFADLFILRDSEKITSLDDALDTFIHSDDSGVEAVITSGKAVYGERDFITAFNRTDNLDHYGKLDSMPQLSNKYFLVPPALEGFSFDELYGAYSEYVASIDIPFSKLRALEDDVYNEMIDELKQEYCE